MKYAYLSKRGNSSHHNCQKGDFTASFFFNARGEYLERSVLGMYRSLLVQVLQAYPDLQDALDNQDFDSDSKSVWQNLNIFKDLFSTVVLGLGRRSLTVFVDALDECDEQQATDMVQYFEDLTEECTENNILLRICFSSRHYPYIIVRRGLQIILENQPGHTTDLQSYTESRLRITDKDLVAELMPQLLRKSGGIFLWVVLVVELLNREEQQGRLALKTRLREIPSDLSTLFKSILTRDGDNKEQLLLSILWILYAARPLRPGEFYHALWSGLLLKRLADADAPRVGDDEVFNRSVVSFTKGLAETTKSDSPTVQFIHESVRDFLIKDNGLQELWPEISFDLAIPGHQKLKDCCYTYMTNNAIRGKAEESMSKNRSSSWTAEFLTQYPFLDYASQYVLHHADAVANAIPQDDFLSLFPFRYWMNACNAFGADQMQYYLRTTSLLYILAEKGHTALVRTRLRADPNIDIKGRRYSYPLFAALALGDAQTAMALLDVDPSIHDIASVTEYLGSISISKWNGRTPLSWAAQEGQLRLMELLLFHTEASISELDEGGQTPLYRAVRDGQDDAVELLLKNGANITTRNKDGSSPIRWAIQQRREDLVSVLLQSTVTGHDDKYFVSLVAKSRQWDTIESFSDGKMDLDFRDKAGRTPLMRATASGDIALISDFVERGASLELHDSEGNTALLLAASSGLLGVVSLLINKGVDVNTSIARGDSALLRALVQFEMEGFGESEHMVTLLHTAGATLDINIDTRDSILFWATGGGFTAKAKAAIDNGADVNVRNSKGATPLLVAIQRRYDEIALLLIDRGADVNLADNAHSTTPLMAASTHDGKRVLEHLLETEANIEAEDEDGETALLLSAQTGDILTMEILVRSGANIHHANKTGDTCRSISVRYHGISYANAFEEEMRRVFADMVAE